MPLVLARPNYPPHVCIVCGVGERRKWFVDLQLPIDNYFNPVTAGAVYLCNECWDSIAVETAKQAQILLIGTEPWKGIEYVEPTYKNEEQLDSELTMKEQMDEVRIERGTGSSFGEISLGSTEGTGNSTTEDDRPTERDSETPESDNLDEQAEPVREFRSHFGN